MSQPPETARRRGFTFIEFCIWFAAWIPSWFAGKVLHAYLPISSVPWLWRYGAAFGGGLLLCWAALALLRTPKLGLSRAPLRQLELTVLACIAGLCVGLSSV